MTLEYKANIEWRASIAAKNTEGGGGTIIVQLPVAPSSDQVPKRIKNEEGLE